MEERRCLRCGAPYDEGATVCFTCGASIGELETPTQPVRAPKRPAASTAVDGSSQATPQSPASVAPTAPVTTAPATTATAPQPHSRPLTVGSSYQAPRPAEAPRPRRKMRWPLVAGLLVVLVALAVGGAIEARALLAPPPVPRTTTYHDQQRRFSFIEPSLWTVTPQANGALLTDSTGASSLAITVAPAQQGQTASAIADTLAAQQGLQTGPSAIIGGDSWEQRSGNVTGSDGATRIVTAYVDVHAGSVYTIQTSSPTSVANSINTLVYQPLLASFAFH
ncbi:MAG TPA: hypothetical protein VFN78_04940 [Ktedonobacterales bacterium]|nr:hypothetical protein [Ktedonobacterales bacterium]